MKWMREVHAPSAWRGSAQGSLYTSGGVCSMCMCEPVCAHVPVLRKITRNEGGKTGTPCCFTEETLSECIDVCAT